MSRKNNKKKMKKRHQADLNREKEQIEKEKKTKDKQEAKKAAMKIDTPPVDFGLGKAPRKTSKGKHRASPYARPVSMELSK
mmetsp:Transcript_37250/g.60332  ORF Transcript_37250/g.60332 Transcript_37250/m.60332 type:complete len:81 (+) Transcript_37250:1399-1641(+)